MEARGLPAAVLAAASDRRGGALEVAATALDGLLEVADDPPLLERAVTALLAGQPAMAPIWHLAQAARAPDPPAALAALRQHLTADADAAAAAATAWLLGYLAGHPGRVATVSHSSLVDRVLVRVRSLEGQDERRVTPPLSGLSQPPRWGSVADPAEAVPGPSTAPAAAPGDPVVGLVGADAIGPGGLLNATGTRELVGRVPALVVATAHKLVPAEVFGRLGGPGFEVVPLEAVAAVVVGGEVLSPAAAGRRARDLAPPPA
jgi:hypothetical protein